MNIETERQRREGDWTERKKTKKERQGRYLQREKDKKEREIGRKERDILRNRERERERQKYEK